MYVENTGEILSQKPMVTGKECKMSDVLIFRIDVLKNVLNRMRLDEKPSDFLSTRIMNCSLKINSLENT